MILVLFLLIALSIILIFATSIKIDCSNLYVSNIPEFQYDFTIKIGLYLFNKIKIFGVTINKEKFKNRKIFKMLKQQLRNNKLDISLKSEDMDIFKKSHINLEQVNAKIQIGTEDVILTSAIVGILASAIGIVLGQVIKKYEEGKYRYVILPYYNRKNIFQAELNCIIYVKLVHIIYVIYMLSKKRSENKHERTSNRRSYDYSYE